MTHPNSHSRSVAELGIQPSLAACQPSSTSLARLCCLCPPREPKKPWHYMKPHCAHKTCKEADWRAELISFLSFSSGKLQWYMELGHNLDRTLVFNFTVACCIPLASQTFSSIPIPRANQSHYHLLLLFRRPQWNYIFKILFCFKY